MAADLVRLLRLASLPVDWGVRAGSVRAIVPAGEWAGAAPIDAAAAVGLVSLAREPSRVLVLDAAGGELPIEAHGEIALVDVEAGALAELPLIMLGDHLAGVRIVFGERALLVLDAGHVAYAARPQGEGP